MASAGTIALQLRLESAAFRQELKQATGAVNSSSAKMRASMRQLQGATQNLNRQFGQLKTGLVALAGALAIRQFSTFTKTALNSSGAIKDVADKVGLTTTQLQQMRFAATQNGVAITALDMGMQRFSRRLGEVAQGTGELLGVAEKYGVSLRDSEGQMRSNIDVLKDFSDVIKNAESDQERLRIAFKLFDSEGAALVNTLRDGRVGLEKFMQQAIDFGVVMDSSVIAKAKTASDSLAALQQIFGTAFDTAIIKGFADALTLSKQTMTDVRDAGQRFGEIVGAAMRGVLKAAEIVADNIKLISAAIGALVAMKAASIFTGIGTQVLALGTALVKAHRATTLLNIAMTANPAVKLTAAIVGLAAAISIFKKEAGTVEQAQKNVAKLTQRLNELRARPDAKSFAISREIKQLEGQLVEAAAAISKFSKEASKSEEKSKAMGVGVSLAAQKIAKLTGALKLQSTQYKQLSAALNRSKKDYDALVISIEIENEATAANIDLTTTQGKEWLKAAEANKALKRQLDEQVKKESELQAERKRQIEENQRLMTEPFKNAISSIQSSFSEMFEGIFSGGVNSFGDLAKSIKKIFIRLAAEIATLLIFRPVVGNLLGGLGLGGMSGQLGLGGATGGSGDVLSLSSLGDSLSFATGLFADPAAGTFLGNMAVDVADFFGASMATSDAIGAAFDATGWGILGGTAARLLGLGSDNPLISGGLGFAGSLGGAMIGGELGTILGMAGGPAGAVIGAFAGTALSGLFGGGGFANGPLTEGFTSVRNGLLSVDAVGSTNGATVESGRQWAEAGASLVNSLVNQGILSLTGEGIRFDTKFGNFRTFTGPTPNNADDPIGGFLGVGTDAEKVLVDTIKGMVENGFAQVDSPELQEIIKNSAATTVAQFMQEVQQEAERFNVQSLPFLQSSGQLVDFIRAQRINDESSLSPTERLTEAQRQFGDILSRVRGGETGLTQTLTQAAGTLLSIGRENFASSVSFANLEQSTISSLLSVADNFSNQDWINGQIEAMQQQTSVIQSGDGAIVDAIESLKREIQLLRESA